MNRIKMVMGMKLPKQTECDDEPTPIIYDTYIGAEAVLPKVNGMVPGTDMSRVKMFEGYPIGKADKNPILDTRAYNV